MIPFDTKNWGMFNLTGENGLFQIESCKCSNAGELLEDGDEIEYIGAKKDDNGLMRYVKRNEELITKGNCIIFICDGQGSVGYTNYIDHDFIGSTTLSVGYNEHLNENIGLFLVTVLDLERYRYSFGRKYKTNLEKASIKLPMTTNGTPDWKYMNDYIESLKTREKVSQGSIEDSLITKPNHKVNFDTGQWKEFLISELFKRKNIYKSVAHVKNDMSYSDTWHEGYLPFISRTEKNNACDCYVPIDEVEVSNIEKGNCLTIGDTTATVNYQGHDFVTGDHMVVCRANWINKYTGLFVKTLLDLEKYRYNYGRAFKLDVIRNTKIKLPVDIRGNPDWYRVEEIMKSCPYSDRI